MANFFVNSGGQLKDCSRKSLGFSRAPVSGFIKK